MEYTHFFPGNIAPHLYTCSTVHGALRLGLLSSPIEIYATIGLGIFVPEKEIYVTIVGLLGVFVLENFTWPLPRNDPKGMGGYTQPTSTKTKSIFKCI